MYLVSQRLSRRKWYGRLTSLNNWNKKCKGTAPSFLPLGPERQMGGAGVGQFSGARMILLDKKRINF
jgi:hypothetical protein